MKNHGCEAYSSQLWHVFFTTVEKAYHSRAHMISPKASQDKPPCKTQQKPMEHTTEAYARDKKARSDAQKTVSTLPGKNGSSQ